MLFAVLGGLAISIQVPTNAALSKHVGALQTTLMSFMLDLCLLALIVALTGSFPGMAGAVGVPLWELLGGFAGAVSVCLTVIATPHLGVALELTMFMLGQLLMGMVVDEWGLFGSSAIAVVPLRIFGAILVITGIASIYQGRKGSSNTGRAPEHLARFCAVAFASGVASAIQSPINATLAGSAGVFGASLINFIVGTIFLLVVTLIVQKGKLHSVKGLAPWKLVGGAYGIVYTIANVVATPIIGVGLMMACGMLGQLSGGMAVDTWGLLEAPRVKVDRWRIVGILVIAAGICCIAAAKVLG